MSYMCTACARSRGDVFVTSDRNRHPCIWLKFIWLLISLQPRLVDEVSRALNFSRLEALGLRSWLVSFGAEPRAPLRLRCCE